MGHGRGAVWGGQEVFETTLGYEPGTVFGNVAKGEKVMGVVGM